MKRCRDEKGIDSAILYGSYARKTENPNSDVDVTIIINNKFEINQLIKKINHSLNQEILKIIEIKLRNKLVIYFKELPKVEIGLAKDIIEIKRYYLGSKITYKLWN